MWNKLIKELAMFSSAVVTGVDANGYPFSFRCVPLIDDAEQVLRIQLPVGIQIQSGRAGLLCHSHDEQLWNLKNFVVHGELEIQPGGCVFRPQRFIPGSGTGGALGDVKMMLNAGRSAKRYLTKRVLPRPTIPWDAIKTLREESKQKPPTDQ
ncbi:MAG TPA: hypothetical protein PLD20_06325 [Blastocatellia bacterium]|nr:hypothetical protein [Blastocatellia bacterium]HMV84596.1 hypothetical protein [Blastocatellia bacterium]HMX25261.1 hypothetical protein [Blastocatellia bacterium]HMY70347.1 hypothetical protein [Blastocatellia bacterium]HMZ17523.1 hypothetical protein [Blastocatellia bacterium]